MEEKSKRAYHITKKSNLFNIQRNLNAIRIWKDRLYSKESFNDLAIVSFDLEGVQYGQRIDSAGDFFTTSAISPDNISVVQIVEKSEPQNFVLLDNIGSFDDRKYQIQEKRITELSIEDIPRDKSQIIDELASYEHKKWSECQDRIHWTGKQNKDGSIEISEQNIKQMQRYINLDYEQADDIYIKEITKAVLETFYIMQENNMINQLGISDEKLLLILGRTEYNRRNNWNKYMLSLCNIQDGKYVIPAERVKWWEEEIITPYEKLSEKLKEYDRVEVYNIFSEIEKYKTTEKPNHDTPDEEGR